MGCINQKTSPNPSFDFRNQRSSINLLPDLKGYGYIGNEESSTTIEAKRKSRLLPFYEELQNMYKKCSGDLKLFIHMIQEQVSEFYITLSQETLSNMNHEEIAAQQSKIIISEEILFLNLNILKVIGRNHNFQYDKETFRQLNKFQNHLVGYMKTKYPRGQQTFVSGDLMKIFKEFDRVNDLQYDILKNSNTYFGQYNDDEIIKGIKLFLNKVMKQCDRNFPLFQKMMQDRAFLIRNQKGEKVSLNYKIGRKISQNVSRYQKLGTGVLQMFSPQIFRVLIKWMQDLEDTINKTSQKINQNQSFKCYVGEKDFEDQNKEQQRRIQFDYVNSYQYGDVVEKLITRIQGIKDGFSMKNKQLLNYLDQFNSRLLKVLNQADPKQKYVPMKEIQTIKYSSFNTKFVEYILAEKLVFAIKELIKIGQSFESQNMMTLDLIKFKVTDLMRCMITGSKKEILQVYENFKKLQANGDIEIVKIKNRLSTPLNDAMIIFVMKGSWIICEAQLILSQSGDKIDKKSKNVQLLNHFFYELERSPYGILAEIAVLLSYKDSKISYQNKITFKESQISIEKCQLNHRQKFQQIQDQQKPFICSRCSSFYSKYENLFKFYQCTQCKISICSKCILKKNPELQAGFIMRVIQRQLQQKISSLQKQKKQRQFSMGVKRSNGTKDLKKKVTPKSILNLFHPEKIQLTSVFKDTKKVPAYKLMGFLNSKFSINQRDSTCYFLLISFSIGQANFRLYSYEPSYKQIQNTFDSKEKYDDSSTFSFSSYDMLFMIPKDKVLLRSANVKEKHLFLFLTRQQLDQKIEQIQKFKSEGKIQSTQEYQIVSCKLQNGSQLVIDYTFLIEKIDSQRQGQDTNNINYTNVEKKEFKYPSLKILAQKLPALKSAQSTISFDDLGVETKHLSFFNTIDWKANIKELKITKNKIDDISLILENCPSLQRFYFNENFVKKLIFTKDMPNLQILNGSSNEISTIQGINFIASIKKLLLNSNKLTQFPKSVELKQLTVLNLKKNYLQDIESLLKSAFPQIQQLIISGQSQQRQQLAQQQVVINNQGMNDFFRQQKNVQSVIPIEYPKLKYFQSQDNRNLLLGKQIQFYSENLQKISLNDCSIQKLTFCKLACFENLKYLHLVGCKIKLFDFLDPKKKKKRQLKQKDSSLNSVQIDTTYHNQNLIELTLANNQIQHLPILKFMSLKKLSLQHNRIKDIRSLSKSKIPQLQYLNLSYNQFTQLCPLYFNKLKEITLNGLQKLNKTNQLFSSSSQLNALQKVTIQKCPNVDFTFNISISNNALTKLKELYLIDLKFVNFNKEKENSCLEIPTLEKFILQDCTFDFFPILKLPKLKKLTLSFLRSISFKNIQKSKLQTLESLTMYQCHQISDDQIQRQLSVMQQISPVQKSPEKKLLDLLSQQKMQNPQFLNQFFSLKFDFPQLKSLNLSSCQLKSVKGMDFVSYKNLQYLRLEKIKTQDGKIPRIKAPNLKQITVNQLKIPELEYFLNGYFEKLQVANFDSNQIQYVKDSTLSNLVSIKKLSFRNNRLKKFVCSDQLQKLTSLDLTQNNLTGFPRIKAKNLTELKLHGNPFEQVYELQNCDLPLLEEIEFSNCDLSKSTFPKFNMPGLQKLQLVSCKISDMNNLARSSLPQLRQLNLERNQLTTLPALSLPQLLVLNLQNNKLKDCSFVENSKFQSLIILNLSTNPFTTLPEPFQLLHLKQLYFNKIPLGSLPLIEMPQVQIIHVQEAQLTDISEFALGQYKFIETLNLSKNKLTKIPKFFMQNLQFAVFDDNEIDDIKNFSQSNFPYLTDLSFQKNKLLKVPNFQFRNVKNIDFSSNPISQLFCFNENEYPQMISMTFNNTLVKKLKHLPKMPKLQQLSFMNSKIQDLEWLVKSVENLPKLKKLNLSSNLIQKVSLGLEGLQSVQQLDLRDNPISNIQGLLSDEKIVKKLSSHQISLKKQDQSQFQQSKAKLLGLNPRLQINRFIPKKEQTINV